jgi:regulator of PEP synthase PpsR (kinase-PPPase family)
LRLKAAYATRTATINTNDPALLAQFNLKPEERLAYIRQKEQEEKLQTEQKAEAERMKVRRALVNQNLRELDLEYYKKSQR